MESQSGSGSNIHHRTHHSTNSSETQPFNSEKKPELSHDDHIHFMPNSNSTTSTPHNENAAFLHTNDQTNLANPFAEFHSPYPNNSDPSFSSTQNPFLVFGDHDDANESHKLHGHAPFEPNFHHQLPTYESSSLGNPFHDSHKIGEHHDHGNDWHHEDHWNFPNHEETSHASSSSQLSHPLFTLESTQNQQLDDVSHKNHKGFESSTQQNMHDSHFTGFESSTPQHIHDSLSASSNTEKDTHVHPKSQKETMFALESSADDMLGRSIPKHEQKSSTQQNMHDSHSAGFESSSPQHDHDSLSASSNTEKDTHVHPKSQKENMLASESSVDDFPVRPMPKHEQKISSTLVVPETIQNPPIQIMERQENCSVTPSSTPRIPLHVFAKDKLNAQWSNTSNESLFSIQMGKSFSNDMAWLSKSGELDKNVDHMNNMPGGVQSNHPPLSPQPQATKFNDISSNFVEQHESNSKVTEAKAVETMREVIMETSTTPENNQSKGSTTVSIAAMHSDTLSSSNNDHSRHSNGSTQSFAFKSHADGDKTHSSNVDKTHSSKHDEETKKQVKQSEQQQNEKATVAPPAAQNTKPASNTSQNKWLSCFTCCH